MPEDVDACVRQLYEEPPDRFVATRAAAVAAARKAGEKDTAKRLAALRKPTVAAWLVNLLAWRRPDLIGELVDLAAALRAAQRDLQGDQLRELSVQRRQVVSALVAQAHRLAVDTDAALGGAKLPLADVETTLTAALADTEVAEQVRTGRLIRTATYAGFGEVPRPRLRLVTDAPPPSSPPSPPPSPPPTSGTDDERRRDLRQQLGAARAAETRAGKNLERAEAAERDAGHAVTEIEAALAELERRRAEAHHDVADRKLARRAAQRDAAAARRLVGDLQAALEDLDERP